MEFRHNVKRERAKMRETIKMKFEKVDERRFPKITEHRKRHAAEQEAQYQVIKEKNEQTLEAIESRDYTKEDAEITDSYRRQLAELKHELESITPPAIDNDTLSVLETEIDNVRIEKKERRKEIGHRREETVSDWKAGLEKEKKRHSSAIAPSSSGRGRQQALQALEHSIRNVQLDRDEAITDLQSTQIAVDEDHKLRMDDFEEERIALADGTEIEALKLEIQVLWPRLAVDEEETISNRKKRCRRSRV